MTISHFSKVASLVLLLTLTSVSAFAGVGSSNTAIADPPVPHPTTTSLAKLFSSSTCALTTSIPQTFSYTPPADCPAPWAKVILVGDFSVSAGIQYDRTANFWLGPTNIYFGTTSEPDPSDSRHWHVQRDLTDYCSIFTTAQQGTADIGNLVNNTYTGVIYGTATMEFYPPSAKAPPPYRRSSHCLLRRTRPAAPSLSTPPANAASPLSQTLSLPTNIQKRLSRRLRAKPE